MFICGSNFTGGGFACALTPTGIENINYIELKNGIYDDLYITKDTELELNNEYPKKWDFNTILWAEFHNNTDAGNVGWNLETTSHLVLKSRTDGRFEWKTLSVKKVNSLEDFEMNYPDYFTASGQTVEYAVVPVLYGCEGVYASTRVTSKFDKMFLIEGNTVWGTEITDGFCDTTRNVPSATVELLHSRYPVFIRNTIANYDTGNCRGSFVPFSKENECELAYDSEYDYQRIRYQREFMDYICDSIPKILKLPDGRLWLVQVTPNPADTANQIYNNREISWSWVEVGDVNSEEDLYYLGFSNVEPEWWSHG